MPWSELEESDDELDDASVATCKTSNGSDDKSSMKVEVVRIRGGGNGHDSDDEKSNVKVNDQRAPGKKSDSIKPKEVNTHGEMSGISTMANQSRFCG